MTTGCPRALREAILDGTPEDVVRRYAALPELAATMDFGEYDEDVVIIDTETTGVSFKRDELTQIAAARLDRGEITGWYVTFVDPGKPIPEDITHLTGISDEDVQGAPTPSEALADLVEFVGDSKLVAHNANFDRMFVTNHPAGYPLLENQWIDSLEMARIALPRMKAHRLIDLVKAFDAPLSTHRADEDVVATCALYRILLAGIRSIPAPLLAQIASFAEDGMWQFGEVFRYFALMAAEEEGIDELPIETLAMRFSLAHIRKGRVEGEMWGRKPKADAMAMPDDQHDEVPVLRFPSEETVRDAFAPDGLLGSIYGDFEERDPQSEMGVAVNNAFSESRNLVVEAGTGTGKSMAYLVPSALLASKNDIGVGIATKTNALLDQIVYEELPALSEGLQEEELLDRPLSYVPLKGFTHYPCLLKVQRIERTGPQMREVANEEISQAPALSALLSYIEQTGYDDMDGLKIDYRVLPRAAITTNSHECLRQRCPFFGRECFVFGRRMQAECADIVVTNHSLLFYDAVLDNALLPPLRYWVVDEAHSVEEDARRALEIRLSVDELKRAASRLSSTDPSGSLLAVAGRSLADGAKLMEALASKARSASLEFDESLAGFEKAAKDLLFFDTDKKSSYDMFDLWINEDVRSSERFEEVRSQAMGMAGRIEKLVGVLQDMVVLMDDEPKARTTQRSLASLALQLKEAAQAADSIFAHPSDEYVYYAKLNRHEGKGRNRSGGNAFHAELFDVGSALDGTLYERTRSVVYTSATITVDGSFEPFLQSVGLASDDGPKAELLELDPCFDFDERMRILVISDIAEPNDRRYLDQLKQLLEGVHIAQGGSVLTLFTNKRDMEKCYETVSPALREEGLRLISQRRGVSVKGIRDEFLKDESLSLFALKSFWEGFDAPGSTLRSVVVPRLPFNNPNDPLSKERGSRDDRAWGRYDLPRAIIELRQAAGRLIRKADDEGSLILCDSRLVSKSYGRAFVSSLPSSNVKVLTMEEAIEELSR